MLSIPFPSLPYIITHEFLPFTTIQSNPHTALPFHIPFILCHSIPFAKPHPNKYLSQMPIMLFSPPVNPLNICHHTSITYTFWSIPSLPTYTTLSLSLPSCPRSHPTTYSSLILSHYLVLSLPIFAVLPTPFLPVQHMMSYSIPFSPFSWSAPFYPLYFPTVPSHHVPNLLFLHPFPTGHTNQYSIQCHILPTTPLIYFIHTWETDPYVCVVWPKSHDGKVNGYLHAPKYIFVLGKEIQSCCGQQRLHWLHKINYPEGMKH